MPEPDPWFETDEAEDVFGSIRHCLRCYDFVTFDPHAWKWIVLSLHSALQGACICHLVTTCPPIGVISPKDVAEWLNYLEQSRSSAGLEAPEVRVLPLPALLKRIRKPRSAGDRSNVEGVTLSDSEFNWLKRFHETLRNQFTHFTPQGWSIQISSIPEFTKLAVRIIAEIAHMGWAFRHKDHHWWVEFNQSLNDLEFAAESISPSGADH